MTAFTVAASILIVLLVFVIGAWLVIRTGSGR